jgi:hypothetical protein
MENSNELGGLLSMHEENQKATVSTLAIGLVCLGMTVPMAIFFTNEETISFNKVLFGICACLMLVGGFSCVWSYIKNRNGRVSLFENGLTVEKGGKTQEALWTEIASVTEKIEKMYMNGSYIYDRYSYHVEKRSGETFDLSNMVSDIDQIGRRLKEKTFEHLYPQIVARIESGETYLFNQMPIDKNAIDGIPWSSLASVKLREGTLEVKDKEGNAVIKGSYGATPNAHLLMAVLTDRLPLES